jgi:hypothetical protein
MSSIKRFSTGAIFGLVIAAIYWSTTYYFGYQLTLIQGIIGCLILAITCGLMTLKWGYQTLQTLLDRLHYD